MERIRAFPVELPLWAYKHHQTPLPSSFANPNELIMNQIIPSTKNNTMTILAEKFTHLVRELKRP